MLHADRGSTVNGLGPVGAPREGILLIAGPGRAGTSFLVQFLVECGVATSQDGGDWYHDARAGLESSARHPGGLPAVVKDPWAHEYLDAALRDGVQIRAILAPVRDLGHAARSRVMQSRAALVSASPEAAGWRSFGEVPGGIVYSLDPHDQEAVLARGFFTLMETASRHGIPVVTPHFPTMVQDFEALWSAVAPVLEPVVDADVARRAFDRAARPDLVRIGATAEPEVGPALLEELGRRLQRCEAELAGSRAELSRERELSADLDTSLHRAQEAADQLRQALDDSRAEAATLRGEVTRLAEEHGNGRRALAECRERLDALGQVLAGIQSSRSWRLTAPARRAQELMRQP